MGGAGEIIEMEGGPDGGAVERDENGSMSGRRWRIPDREAGALKRLAKIMEKYPTLQAVNCRSAIVITIGRLAFRDVAGRQDVERSTARVAERLDAGAACAAVQSDRPRPAGQGAALAGEEPVAPRRPIEPRIFVTKVAAVEIGRPWPS
jgi:hypothetical protein